MDKKYVNAQGEQFNVKSDDFSFVQENAKIFDRKLDTKPTTFFKDAIRRFCKNKSSVVGAIIIAIIVLLSIAVPIFSPHDMSYSHTSEKQMKPKVFESGTGFWDGTEKVTEVAAIYDEETQSWLPKGVNAKAVSNVVHYVKDGVDFVDYTYDGYEDVYGEKTGEIPQANHEKYVQNGWLSYDIERYTVSKSSIVSATIDTSTLGTLKAKNIVPVLPEGIVAEQIYNTKPYIEIVDEDEIVGALFDTATNLPIDESTGLPIEKAYIKKDSLVIVDANGNYLENEQGQRVCNYTKLTWEITLDYSYATVDFTVLDAEKCPVSDIQYARYIYYEGEEILKLYGTYSGYKTLGYSKAPKFIFGTDDLGKDLITKCFSGMGKSLIFAIVIMLICFSFGLVWGSISGYFGGNVDLLMERFMDILGGVPTVVVVTLFRLHLGDKLWVFAVALCITGWMGTASRTRTQFYRFKGREYVLASRTLGSSDIRLIFRHVLPNALGTIVTGAALMIPSLIFTESSLAYLGLGLQGGDSFGSILAHNQQFLKNDPALILFPAVIISLLMISFNLFGNGLRDALNPSLKGSE